MTISANLIDIEAHDIYAVMLCVENGYITAIDRIEEACDSYILPGFIDAHIHIESSMLVPSEFARLAVRHGTVATVSDPHEIANVLGVEGIDFMIDNAARSPFHFYFGAPSCVPATPFESAGAMLDAQAISALLEREDIYYLSEVMNVPGVLNEEHDIMAKIDAAKSVHKRIDGHAPELRGAPLARYIDTGISSDHEAVTLEEGREKLQKGMMLQIREGSAAKNFEALIPLIAEFPRQIMFCSDDRHPDELLRSHIRDLVLRGRAKGYDFFDLLYAACIAPIVHYGLDVGRLRVGDRADFVMIRDVATLEVEQTYCSGVCVYGHHALLLEHLQITPPNHFLTKPIQESALHVTPLHNDVRLRVIEAMDGSLLTRAIEMQALVQSGNLVSDPSRDLLKIVVLSRYEPHPAPAIGFIRGFGLKTGAIASSVAHDSHNIIALGCDDASIARAINTIIANQGGICALNTTQTHHLSLEVAGLMSSKHGETVAARYEEIEYFSKEVLGSSLHAPFMTLSFMALLVIPELKLSDKGLFDGVTFSFTALQS